MSNLRIWISPLSGQAYIGKVNKKGTERLNKEPMDDTMVDCFVGDYLIRELKRFPSGAVEWPHDGKIITVSYRTQTEEDKLYHK